MTENEARAICAELGVTFSIRQRKGIAYVYVSRWLPRAAAEAAGHQASYSSRSLPLNRMPVTEPLADSYLIHDWLWVTTLPLVPIHWTC